LVIVRRKFGEGRDWTIIEGIMTRSEAEGVIGRIKGILGEVSRLDKITPELKDRAGVERVHIDNIVRLFSSPCLKTLFR
jgi:hypothetical protein